MNTYIDHQIIPPAEDMLPDSWIEGQLDPTCPKCGRRKDTYPLDFGFYLCAHCGNEWRQ